MIQDIYEIDFIPEDNTTLMRELGSPIVIEKSDTYLYIRSCEIWISIPAYQNNIEEFCSQVTINEISYTTIPGVRTFYTNDQIHLVICTFSYPIQIVLNRKLLKK